MSKKVKKKVSKPAAEPAAKPTAARPAAAETKPARAAERSSGAEDQLLALREDLLGMSDRIWLRWAAAIVALGTFLRYFDITNRPVHHDEGVNGWFMTNLIRDNSYKYDPANYHGPSLYYWAWP